MLDQGDILSTSGDSNVNLRLLVVSGNYRKTEDGVVIELFGRCEDGRSVTVLYGGFRPYFYIVEPKEEDIADLRRDPLVVGITDRTLWHSRTNVNCAKVVITYPFEVPKYRKRFQEKGYEILAADILLSGQKICGPGDRVSFDEIRG